ncbi:MAG: hypothetical protein HYU73_07765, partial [Betaproteobacteria bacterium]|nr:hypothetical protein [Betaproteobacteria bacterium]
MTEVKLPLDHSEGEIRAAILKRLKIAADDLVAYSIYRRGVDARNPSAIVFSCTLDIEVRNETELAARLQRDPRVSLAPDMHYRFVAQAPAGLVLRPVVIGTGPCGMFAGLLLAQMGFRPIILERGKAV